MGGRYTKPQIEELDDEELAETARELKKPKVAKVVHETIIPDNEITGSEAYEYRKIRRERGDEKLEEAPAPLSTAALHIS